MARLILTFALGALVGIAAGVAAGVYVVPHFLPQKLVAPEGGASAGPAGAVIARGEFTQPDPADAVHRGAGKVRAAQDLLVFDADFEVGPGPGYRVYLVPARGVTPLTNVEKTMYVDLGPLKSFKGAQSYPIPGGVDLARYATVVIWSEHFGTLISPAELNPG